MNNNILTTENIVLNKQFSNQEEAIKFTGNILVEQNYVEPSYVDKMLEREKVTSTFMEIMWLSHMVQKMQKAKLIKQV